MTGNKSIVGGCKSSDRAGHEFHQSRIEFASPFAQAASGFQSWGGAIFRGSHAGINIEFTGS
jgi:hypothetical protein